MALRLNDFCRFRFGTPMTCDLILEQRRYRLHQPELAALLLGLTEPANKGDILGRLTTFLPPDLAEATLDDLVASALIVDADYCHPLAAEATKWVNHGWTESLVLQRVTDSTEYVDVGVPRLVATKTEQEYHHPEPMPIWHDLDLPYSELPSPAQWPQRPLVEVMLERRTHRPWAGVRVDATMLSRILLEANKPLVRGRKLSENAGNTPESRLKNVFGDFETYVAIHDVDGLTPGLYHYDPKTHSLGVMRTGGLGEELKDTFVGQARAGGGAFAVILSVVWERHLYRYPKNQRGYRTIMILAGQLAHRYLMGATAYGLVTFPTPAHNPEATDELLGTERLVESAIYLVSDG